MAKAPTGVVLVGAFEVLVSGPRARLTCLECYTAQLTGSSGLGGWLGGEFVEVDEGAAVEVVAVVGELAAAEPLADGAGLHLGLYGGGVDVDQAGLVVHVN